MPQQVIFYRNPAEAAFWDLFMNSPNTFPVIMILVTFFVSIIILFRILPPSSLIRNPYWHLWREPLAVIISLTIAVLVGWWMWI